MYAFAYLWFRLLMKFVKPFNNFESKIIFSWIFDDKNVWFDTKFHSNPQAKSINFWENWKATRRLWTTENWTDSNSDRWNSFRCCSFTLLCKVLIWYMGELVWKENERGREREKKRRVKRNAPSTLWIQDEIERIHNDVCYIHTIFIITAVFAV